MPANIVAIGSGNMGDNMVRQLQRAGHSLTVFARRAEVMQPFVAEGARAASSLADAARGAVFIMTNVTATADVKAVLLGEQRVIHGARRDAVVCDFSTIDVAAMRRFASVLAKRGIDYLDCPVQVTRGAKNTKAPI